MPITRRRLAATALATPAGAQDRFTATRPVRLLLAFGTGTGADVLARDLGAGLAAEIGQPAVVESLTGGTGIVALRTIGRAAPDGHTLFLAALGNVVINPMVSAAARGTDALVTPIGPVSDNAHVMIIHGALPVRDVREFVAYARARPGEMNFGSPGTGGLSHLAAELFQSLTGIEGVHVPYREASRMLPDMIAGRVHCAFMSAGGLMPLIAEGGIRALGVTAPTRVPELRALPVVEDAGVPGFRYSTWYGLFAAAATPAPLVARLNASLRAALARDALRERMIGQGSDVAEGSPTDLAEMMQQARATWGRIISERRISLE